MIKYNAVQNKYLYKQEDIDRIIEIIQNVNFYGVTTKLHFSISSSLYTLFFSSLIIYSLFF